MFAVLFVLILTGFPVAFTLAGTGLIFAVIGHYFDIFIYSDFGFLPSKAFGIIQNFTLIAVPLFVFMGVTLEKSGIAEELLGTAEQLLKKVSGGLTISLIFVGALLAASTGIIGATVVTMGILALPAMLDRGYDKRLSCGTIAAAGTLGQIIPPSIVLVLLGDMMNVPVADLFAGAMFPGLILVGMYAGYVYVRASLNPSLAPRFDESVGVQLSWKEIAKSIVAPILLVLIVLGSILGGVASPTESAACGATGAMLLAGLRRKLSWTNLKDVMRQTTSMTTMVFTLLIGAQFFSVVFRGLYGDELITDFITELELHPHLVFMGVMLLMFILGFFLDFIEICFIIIPIIAPILINDLGFDGIWLAIMFAVNLQTSFLTPPFGFALFYLKGVCPPTVKTMDIYRGVVPFVVIQLIALLIMGIFPEVITWLPAAVFGDK